MHLLHFVTTRYISLHVNPHAILKEAQSTPDKRNLEVHLDTIWTLRRKDYSYREIADFLNERGVKTDYIAVYRLVVDGNPLMDYRDGHLLIGNVDYENRKGCPLRPFRAGLFITIRKKLRVHVLPGQERLSYTWAECHFRLSDVPNHAWIQQLSKNMSIAWNPENPRYLDGRFGYELKFEGDLMAMVCRICNLEQEMSDLGTAIEKTTKFFAEDNSWLAALTKLKAERNAKILEKLVADPDDTEDELCENHLKWHEEENKKINKQFQSYTMPFSA
jgi:hypothetical protein